MSELMITMNDGSQYLSHHGILGMKWGVRRYQNKDGTLTEAGKRRQAKKEFKQDKKNLKNSAYDLYRTTIDFEALFDSKDNPMMRDPNIRQLWWVPYQVAANEMDAKYAAYNKQVDAFIEKYGDVSYNKMLLKSPFTNVFTDMNEDRHNQPQASATYWHHTGNVYTPEQKETRHWRW